MPDDKTIDRIIRLETDFEHHARKLSDVDDTVIEHDRWISEHKAVGATSKEHDQRLQKLEQLKAQLLVLAALGSLVGSILAKAVFK